MDNQGKIIQALDAVLTMIDNIKSRDNYHKNLICVSMCTNHGFELLKNNLKLKNVPFKTITYMMEDPFTVEIVCDDIPAILSRYESRDLQCMA